MWRPLHGMRLFSLFIVHFTIANAQSDIDDLFSGCNSDEYYAVLATGDRSLWTRNEVESLLSTTHRQSLAYTANDEGDDDVWKALIDLDAAESSSDADSALVHLLYSNGVPVPAVPHGTSDTWNREHIWPSSRGVGHDGADFTDVHHLRPADWNVNAVRSNLYFGNCTDECQQPADEEAALDTAKNSFIFTPPASSRGDVARALFYMDVRYSSANNDGHDLTLTDCPIVPGNTDPNEDEDISEMAYLSILLRWHIEDPVDAAEVERNARVCSRWQGNRNPFVDHPDLAFYMFGEPDMSSSYNCSVPPNGSTNLSTVAPNGPSTAPAWSPTASASNATDFVQPGDVLIVGVQSDNPDWVALVALNALPAGTELYLTDNAWLVDSPGSIQQAFFRNNEGTLVLTVPVDIPAGTVFGYGPDVLYGDLWVATDKGFAVSATDGDTVILHTTHKAIVQFISALSSSGPWLESSGSNTFNSTASSALPAGLEDYNVAFPEHFDNCFYAGPAQGTVAELQANWRKPQHWSLSNVALSAVPTLFPSQFAILNSSTSTSNGISRYKRVPFLFSAILFVLTQTPSLLNY